MMRCNSEEWGADVLFNLYLCSVINGTAHWGPEQGVLLPGSKRLVLYFPRVPCRFHLTLHWPELITGKKKAGFYKLY